MPDHRLPIPFAIPRHPPARRRLAALAGGGTLIGLASLLAAIPLGPEAADAATLGGMAAAGAGLALGMGVLGMGGSRSLVSDQSPSAILDAIGAGVITAGRNGGLDYANPKAQSILGSPLPQLLGQPLDQVLQVHEGAVEALGDSGCGALDKLRLVRADGSTLLVQPCVSVLRGADGQAAGTIVVLHDVSEVHQLSRRLDWQASHDPLTGLINRAEFERRVQAAMLREKTLGEPSCIGQIDLHQFKIVNDLCGHDAGDHMLRQLAGLLRKKLRRTDTLARLGGDEFGLILEDCPAEMGLEVAQHLIRVVNDWRFRWQGHSFTVAMTMGLVPLDRHEGDVHSVLSTVDSLCYAAKEEGPNRIEVFVPGDQRMMDRRGLMGWVNRMTRALDEGRFALFQQRYASIHPGEGRVHAEILVRMVDEAGNIVLPGQFIPAAERYCLMPRLDRWTISRAFALVAAMGNPLAQRWSINLSGQSLSQGDLLPYILDQAERHGIRPEDFCLEITETAAIDNMAIAKELMERLKGRGFTFALDDFGSGLSSFSYLKHLPVDYLKIDGLFIRNLCRNPTDQAMVRAIREIARVMGLKTVAEFVEDQDTLALLGTLGVDFAQGYAVARPVPLGGQHEEA